MSLHITLYIFYMYVIDLASQYPQGVVAKSEIAVILTFCSLVIGMVHALYYIWEPVLLVFESQASTFPGISINTGIFFLATRQKYSRSEEVLAIH